MLRELKFQSSSISNLGWLFAFFLPLGPGIFALRWMLEVGSQSTLSG